MKRIGMFKTKAEVSPLLFSVVEEGKFKTYCFLNGGGEVIQLTRGEFFDTFKLKD